MIWGIHYIMGNFGDFQRDYRWCRRPSGSPMLSPKSSAKQKDFLYKTVFQIAEHVIDMQTNTMTISRPMLSMKIYNNYSSMIREISNKTLIDGERSLHLQEIMKLILSPNIITPFFIHPISTPSTFFIDTHPPPFQESVHKPTSAFSPALTRSLFRTIYLWRPLLAWGNSANFPLSPF